MAVYCVVGCQRARNAVVAHERVEKRHFFRQKEDFCKSSFLGRSSCKPARTAFVIDIADAVVRAMQSLGYKVVDLDQVLDEQLRNELAAAIVAAVLELVRFVTFSADTALAEEAALLSATLAAAAADGAAAATEPATSSAAAAAHPGVAPGPLAGAAAAAAAAPDVAAPRPYALAAAAGDNKLAVLLMDGVNRLLGHRIDKKWPRRAP